MSQQGGYHAVHLPAHPARDVVWRVIADYLRPYSRPTDHVVEIGAGYCHWINAVVAARRVAIDSWAGFPAYAAPGVETRVMDVTPRSIETDAANRGGLAALGTGQFDTALASNLLEHFAPDAAAALVGDVATLLKPRGRFILVQPNFRYAYRHYFDDYTHRSIFTDVSLANLLRAHGFAIERAEPRFLPYSMRETRWPIAAWLVRAYLQSPIRPLAGQMLIVGRKS